MTKLLDHGFYPVELPPPFHTKQYSKAIGTLVPSQKHSGSTTFFEGPTFRGSLRTFGVVNPINYFLLSEFIAKNWMNICSIYKKSKCSGSRPIFSNLKSEGRAIKSASLGKKRQNQQHLASGYPIILSIDINRFYNSIYTHSLPWAALGKELAKKKFSAKTLNTEWSDKLDQLVRNCNQQQTVGIAIGPDTSRIISEIILARIDADLCATGTPFKSRQIHHNIDDYQFGVMEISEAELAQSLFMKTIRKYELRVNDNKTYIQQGITFAPNNFQRQFDIVRKLEGKAFIEAFFDLIFSLSAENSDVNVIGYAVKRFAKLLSKATYHDIVQEYLQRLLFASPFQARWILPILLGIYHHTGNFSNGSRLIIWGIGTSARRNDVGSLLWYLYAALFLRIKLSKDMCDLCESITSELVDLVLYHGYKEGLFKISLGAMRQRYRVSDFSSSSWLPLYEIERRGWDTSPSFSKLGKAEDKDDLFAKLKGLGVEFYSTDAAFYRVEAFDGWNLVQNDFAEADVDNFDFGHLLDDLTGFENYD
ncbi:RNA-directed DNA polymerase [Labrys sp. KNU-23]|uniref:RNA-directed DNA polymerase n=1 Tax=Labrys sp. KNU-23 TaxID=2789216 RepID=UPI0011EEB23C|nr:RNA-directed DNA polymerase [Labrys sp. KNU-23]QEN88590.1 RNA-directed DNA polymerase [Labrys sp. KNU-23]